MHRRRRNILLLDDVYLLLAATANADATVLSGDFFRDIFPSRPQMQSPYDEFITSIYCTIEEKMFFEELRNKRERHITPQFRRKILEDTIPRMKGFLSLETRVPFSYGRDYYFPYQSTDGVEMFAVFQLDNATVK